MLTLLVLLIVAILLSLVGKKGQKVEFEADEIEFLGHMPNQKDIRRVEAGLRQRKKLTMLGVALVVLLAMLVDWSGDGNPFSGTGEPGWGRGRAPGLKSYPGWQAGSVEIPPQGFSGRMLTRFETGEIAGAGFLIVAPGAKRKFGWRVVGVDAPSCMLRLEFKNSRSQEVGWFGGYSVSNEEFGEGEHEASFTAWCPRGQTNVDFQFAAMTTSHDGWPTVAPAWVPVNGADIRHREP